MASRCFISVEMGGAWDAVYREASVEPTKAASGFNLRFDLSWAQGEAPTLKPMNAPARMRDYSVVAWSSRAYDHALQQCLAACIGI